MVLEVPEVDNLSQYCLHCKASLQSDENAKKNGISTDPRFCCAGCHYVYCILHDLELDSFYKIRAQAGEFKSTQPNLSS
ncbi:MAG: heavy metal translocating P-type ATPase metal-binding domain-containing protein, partial [Bdellovibrionales bacterium]|nr:heavy metal translocating P-type ATPase metal-binding domain-containing protein [Bdellovibrionales bacterium]